MALMTDQTDEYLQSRADAMQNIESTIVELGGIFSQLAHMIKEQEEIMVRDLFFSWQHCFGQLLPCRLSRFGLTATWRIRP